MYFNNNFFKEGNYAYTSGSDLNSLFVGGHYYYLYLKNCGVFLPNRKYASVKHCARVQSGITPCLFTRDVTTTHLN